MTPSEQLSGTSDGRRVMVLSLHDAYGRYLEAARIVVDLEQLKPGYQAVTGRYLSPCELVDGGAEGFTIELQARLQIIGPPEGE